MLLKLKSKQFNIFWLIILCTFSFNTFSRDYQFWKYVNHSSWFSYFTWVENYNLTFKNVAKRTPLGYLLDSYGRCLFFNKDHYNTVTLNQAIFKLQTVESKNDSYCYLMLIDGSLLRLAPNTSFSITNFTKYKNKYFFSFQVNRGNIFFQSRYKNTFIQNNRDESENLILPVRIKNKLVTYHKRKSPKEFLNPPFNMKKTFRMLNKYIQFNNKKLPRDYSVHYLFSTNKGLVDCDGPTMIEFYVNFLEGMLVKKRDPSIVLSNSTNSNCNLYLNIKTQFTLDNSWQRVHPKYSLLEPFFTWQLNISEYLTSNTPNLFLLREQLFEKIAKSFTETENFDKKYFSSFQIKNINIDKIYDQYFNHIKQYMIRNEGNNLRALNNRNLKPLSLAHSFNDPKYYSNFYKASLLSLKQYKPYLELENEQFDNLNSTQKIFWKIIRERKHKQPKKDNR